MSAVHVPDQLCHYHYPDKEPFLNLGDLPVEALPLVIDELNARAERGETQRAFPAWYMPQRLAAEQRLRELFIAKGGKAERQSPHYFTLGPSPVLEMIYNNRFIRLSFPLQQFREEHTCFSFGDSLWTMTPSLKPGYSHSNRWFEGQLYTYDEAAAIIRDLEIELGNFDSLKKHRLMYVEALVWSDLDLPERPAK